MSSNRSALDALTLEGILMSEEQLLRETQKVRSNGNGANPAQTKGQVAYYNGTSPSITAVKAKPGRGPTQVGEARSLPAEGALATGETQLVTRRGRQRTPKPWLMAVLCRMGLHKGPWAFVAEGNCAQGRECERCGSVHVRTKHQREWVYVSEQTCEQLRTCMRCKDTNCERTKHEWSNSWIVSGAKMAHRCEHCGVEETWDDYGD